MIERVFDLFAFILVFSIGYYVGRGQRVEEIRKKVEKEMAAKPTPGVVRHLTDAEILEKHDPKKRAALEVFDEMMARFGIVRRK